MKIDVDVTEIRALQRGIAGFSDRRLDAAFATALTRTGRGVGDAWEVQLGRKLDRPTPLIQRAVAVQRADARHLESVIRIKDAVGSANPAQILAPHEVGGGRLLKKFEQALQAQGSMPRGHRAVPGRYATLDRYGNVSRGQIVQVLAQLGAQYSPGYQRVIARNVAKRVARAMATGREYVAIVEKVGGLEPGVYQRSGRNLLPIFFYVHSTTYRRRLSLREEGMRIATVELPKQVARAVEEQWQRLQIKMARGR